jgi:PleD family two-component response regulator
MLLQVEPCPELGTRVHLNFLLPEVAGRFLLDGQVTRVGRNGRVAVRFDDLPMDQLDTLLLLYKQTGRKDAKAVKEKVVNQKARAKTPAAVSAQAAPHAGKTHRAAPQAKKVTKVTKAAKGKKAAKAVTKPEKAKVKYSSIEQVTKMSVRPDRSQPDKARGEVNVLVVGEDERMRTLLGVMLERRGWHIKLAE